MVFQLLLKAVTLNDL